MISVIMATFNGEKYIYQQMLSILQQSKQADEVIICDDKSADNTVNIIKEFIVRNNLSKKWRLIVNKINLGYKRNFVNGIEQASGDIIFLSDQDDIWNKDKIEEMNKVFETYKDAVSVISNVIYIDNNGGIVKRKINKIGYEDAFSKFKRKIQPIRKIELYDQLKNNISIGMALAFKKTIVNEVRELVYLYDLSHDVSASIISASMNGCYYLIKPLAYRRIHSNNVSKPMVGIFSRLKNKRKHVKGRYFKIKTLNTCLHSRIMREKLSQEQIKEIKKAIKIIKESVVGINRCNLCLLSKTVYKNNKIINKKIAIYNIMACLF